MSAFLPREGLTLEAAFAPFRATALEPILTGGLLIATYFFPVPNTSLLPSACDHIYEFKLFISSLKWLFAIGALRRLNNLLSLWVLNNFTTDAWAFDQEVAVITGGSSGIGEALVHELAKTSAAICSLDISEPRKPLPSNAFFYKLDITRSSEISAIAQKIRQDHGEPTVLVNNAGKNVSRTILHETEEQIRSVFNVNTISHFMLVKEFLPAMIKQNHGHVVTVASMGSYSVHAQNVDYNCSKASALAFHEGLAQELKSRYNAPKVRTTIVHPVYVRTPMLEPNMAQPKFNEFVLEPETISDAIVKQLHSGLGGQIILPGRFCFVTSIRGWPSWVQELVRNSLNQELAFYGTQGRS